MKLNNEDFLLAFLQARETHSNDMTGPRGIRQLLSDGSGNGRAHFQVGFQLLAVLKLLHRVSSVKSYKSLIC